MPWGTTLVEGTGWQQKHAEGEVELGRRPEVGSCQPTAWGVALQSCPDLREWGQQPLCPWKEAVSSNQCNPQKALTDEGCLLASFPAAEE